MDMNTIDDALKDLLTLNGAIASSLIDWQSGMTLGMAGSSDFQIELASAGNSEVIKAKMATLQSIGLDNHVKDILITLTEQIHIITMLPNHLELCLYLVLDGEKGNLALARNKMQSVAKEF